MKRTVTLLDLLQAIARYARSDAEATATFVYLVNSGSVRLGGRLRGALLDLA